MLSKYDLEEIIKAWPDKDGNSSNPEVYEHWLEMKKQIPTDMFVGVLDQYTPNEIVMPKQYKKYQK